MFPSNPFPQLVPKRVFNALRRLSERIWITGESLRVTATSSQAVHISWEEAKNRPLQPVRAGESWGRLYDQRWCRLVLPKARPRETRYLEWRDQGEATLYIEGTPYYGFDVAHRRCALPGNVKDVWVESICVQSAIWHPDATGISLGGSVFDGAFLATRDDDAWRVYHDLRCLFDLLLVEKPGGPKLSGGVQAGFAQATPLVRHLARALDEAVDALETDGFRAASERLTRVYRDLRQRKALGKAILTGHAHIDLVWLWPERVGEAKAVHTFATANRLMDLYPEYRFAYSQPASYAAVERRSPRLGVAVRRRLRSGRWQATGALYVESDTLLPCGEALARSFTLGQKAFRQLRGGPATLLWLPDVFGYSGCLPQLMRLAGVEYFFTTKLTWNAINRFPHSSFVWRGTDGSEVIAHLTQDCGYNNTLQVEEIAAATNGHAQCGVHPEFLHPTGYGDGGGGPTEEMCERARRLSALGNLPGLEWGHPEAFFERLARHRHRLPVHQGECYLEYHRGTYTTHGAVKAAFRALEQALQARESAAVVLRAKPDLERVWQRMVFAQFHDYIPGSSVPDVYAEGVPELRDLAARQLAESQADLERGKGESCVFNPLPLARQVCHEGGLLELPPLAGVTVKAARVASFDACEAGRNTLGNGRVRLRVDGSGGIRSLTIDGEDAGLGSGAGSLVTYADRPASFEAWDIDRQALSLGRIVRTPAAVTTRVDAAGLRAELSVSRKVGPSSHAVVRYIVEAGSPVLRIEVELDWHEPETLLKLHFPTVYRGGSVRCGAPFGTILRPQQPSSLQAEAMWELPCSRHLTVLDDSGRRGLAVITENKYGFSCRDGDVGVSLVRSPRAVGFDGHRFAYPAGLSRVASESIHTDQGRHVIRLAVVPYAAGGPRETQPAALAETLFAPVLSYRGAPVRSAFGGLEGGATLVPCWAVPGSGGSWTLRLHETGGEAGVATIACAAGWRMRRTDLNGRPMGPQPRGSRLAFRSYEIVSLEFTPTKRA